MKKIIYRVVGLVILGGVGWGGYLYYKTIPERQESVPVTKVQKSDVLIRAYSRGELKPARVQPLYAPNLFGTVQVTALATVGSLAREQDLIVEYDASGRQIAPAEERPSVARGVDGV